MEPRELRKALWLGGALMAVTASYTLVKTARDSLFLSLLPATWLPWVYLVVGVVTLAFSMVFERLTRDLSPMRSLILCTTAAAVGLALFGVNLDRNGWWLPTAFYLFVNAYGLVIVSQFWLYTSHRSDPREMKRISGIIGGAAILGGLAGGAVATAVGPHVSLQWLIAVGSGALALSLPLLVSVHRDPRTADDPVPVREEPAGPLLRVSYVRWLAIATLCSVIVTGVLDYQMKIVVQQAYPTAAQLTEFFGRFYVAMNIIALAIQLVGTRRLLQWLGAGSAAIVLPAGLGIGAGATLMLPGFATVVGTRLWDQVVRFSLNKSAVELLFLPLPPDLKRRAKAFIGAGIERIGDAFAGVLILALGVIFTTGTTHLAIVVMALVAMWLFATLRLRAEYVTELGRHLGRMTLDWVHDPVPLNERTVLDETVRLLSSPYERVVLQAIDLLDQNDPDLLDRSLPALLAHQSAAVRARALDRAAASPTFADEARLTAMVRDPDPRVRLMALRARCKRGNQRPRAALDEYFTCDDQALRSTALACVLEQVDPDEEAPVRQLIEQYLSTGVSEDRVAVAEALGARGVPKELVTHLEPLFDDADPQVRRAALRSAGRAGLRKHVPVLIRALADDETERAAREGLVALGDEAVTDLEAVLMDSQVALDIRRDIPLVLGELSTPRSVTALLGQPECGDVVLSYRMLKACNHLRLAHPDLEFPAERIVKDLEGDVRAFLLAERHANSQASVVTANPSDNAGPFRPAQPALPGPPAKSDQAGQFLVLVLRERMAQAYNRAFRRLALLYPPMEMFSAYLGSLSEDARVRANAAEYIDRALSPELRALVMPLLPGAKSGERDELADSRFNIPRMTPLESLRALLDGDDLWLRSCALHVAGVRREQELRGQVEENLSSPDSRVHDTAVWAHAALSLAGAR